MKQLSDQYITEVQMILRNFHMNIWGKRGHQKDMVSILLPVKKSLKDILKGKENYFPHIKKPLNVDKITISKKQLAKFIKTLDPKGDGYLSNWGDVEYEGYNNVLMTAIENEFDTSDNDVELISGIINSTGTSPDKIYPILTKTLGYDGIIANPEWTEGHKIVIPFTNEQIKKF